MIVRIHCRETGTVGVFSANKQLDLDAMLVIYRQHVLAVNGSPPTASGFANWLVES